jgi:hypothetical protein
MPARGPDGPRIDGAIVLLAAIALVAAAYTRMAFGLEWETRAGRIGPGFFPRIIGSLTVALCLVAIVRRVRAGRPPGEASEPGRARLVVATVAVLTVYVALLEPLGALIASALMMLAILSLTNRGRPLANVALSVGVSSGLYALLEIGVGAGLPPGPLPVI